MIKLVLTILAVAGLNMPLQAQQPEALDASAIREDVRILSSESFQGRGPGERGETRHPSGYDGGGQQ